tara:strand:+ start:111 stop:1397 length:1287 start_codon:yes stop_codon:yes gene_type:complete
MGLKESYEKGKEKLLDDNSICKENRDLFKEFFEFEEHKIKRINHLRELDDGGYKTLLSYLSRLRNVNKWFDNKPWKNITKEDIQKVYNDLEDGKLKTSKGEPFKDRRSYYNKIFKSKPFKLAGHKDDLARDVLEYFTDKRETEVDFIDEEGFKKLVSVISKPEHKLLFWLSWDIGENVFSILQLKKKDFTKQNNKDTKSPEYLVNLPKEILKRSRKTRSELTLYPETVRFIDMILERGKEIFVEDPKGNEFKKVKQKNGKYKKLQGKKKFVPFESHDRIFNFEKRQATKIFDSAVKKTGVKTMPKGDKPTWQHLRKGMTCHLLKNGWHSDEINLRLGHKITSRELEAYVSYAASNKQLPKRRLFQSNLEEVQNELEEFKRREKLQISRAERQGENVESLENTVAELKKMLSMVMGESKATIMTTMQRK